MGVHRNNPLFLIIFFSLLHVSFPAYNPSDKYLISCGSNTNVSVSDERVFIGDLTDSVSSLLSKNSSIGASNPNSPSNAQTLNKTARIFTVESSYRFTIKEKGSHFIRLHFYPFKYESYDMSSASFEVSVSGFVLFRDYNQTEKENQIPKEYIMNVNSNVLEIKFKPLSSFAFVNAIEVFTAPEKLLSGSLPIVPENSPKNFSNFFNQVLETVYRVNIGGPLVLSSNDTVWRTWNKDGTFIEDEKISVEVLTLPSTRNISYSAGYSTEIAPETVYRSSRKLYSSGIKSTTANISWDFPLKSRQKYFIRMHFCEFSPSYAFNVYINEWAAVKDLSLTTSTPMYLDFVSEPQSNGSLKISVSTSNNQNEGNATLSGLEIMKMNGSETSFDLISKDSKGKSKMALIGSIVGGFSLVFLVVVVLVLVRRRKRVQKEGNEPPCSPMPLLEVNSHTQRSITTNGSHGFTQVNQSLDLKISLEEISIATENFSEKCIIGTGGFGKVYKGVLNNGTKVAVKRGMTGSGQGLAEFQTEITLLSRIRHRHLVSLIGYCQENSEMILVYEFMENGTLRSHLYGTDLPSLPWKKRLEICIGAARGIHYLHTGSSQGIIHRDVKTANILLDEDFLAKVADFGLSRLGPSVEQTHVSTAVKGSFGYLDPEYFKRQQLTEKSDVYSFGVVLFEVLCARPVLNPLLPREQINLAEWALQWQNKGLLSQIVDNRIAGEINPNSLKKFGEIAEKCLAEHGVERPSISHVLWNLEYALQLQETPIVGDPFEDGSTFIADISLPNVIPRVPPQNGLTSADVSFDDTQRALSTSQVFSQIITNEGR